MTSDETTAAEVIVAITASPSEESIICGTDSKQLYTGALSVADIQRSGDQIRLVFIHFAQGRPSTRTVRGGPDRPRFPVSFSL